MKKRAPVKKESSLPLRVRKILNEAPKSKFPARISPMLATLVDKPFDAPGWSYEVKWDGYRALALLQNGCVELRSRNDKSFNERFYPVFDALKKWKINAVIDGEIVALRENGISDFGSLQNWRSEADGDLVYFVFDIPWFEGRDLTKTPLSDRRAVLESIKLPSGMIRVSESFNLSGLDFFSSARDTGLEGIIAKKSDSLYVPGARSTAWLKIKANKRQEVIIGGYTRKEGSPKPFSALLAGVRVDGKLVYTGKIGTGFNIRQQEKLLAQFKPLVVRDAPFDLSPDVSKPSRFNPRPPKSKVTWLKPELVCEVSFTELTADGIMRHPSFEGLRTDKSAKEVVLETERSTKKIVGEGQATVVKAHKKRDRSTLLNPADETQVRLIDNHEIKFTNLSKIYWPEDKLTKRDMLNYYYQVAPFILPYLKDRPQSLNRYPNGIHGKSFYQKDVTGKVPDWVKKYLYHSSDEKHIDKHFLVPASEADILLMANMGCIEMHPWNSRIQKPNNPDWCIIDLDPDKQSFDVVIEVALVVKQVLDKVSVPSYCKTSGASGLHVYIPLGAKYTYEESREFARSVVQLVQLEMPRHTTIERHVAARKGKMYLDFLQNRPQATLAAPYSLRPMIGASVSMPLRWDEVRKGLKVSDFNIFNTVDRIRETGDLFAPVLAKGIDLRAASKSAK